MSTRPNRYLNELFLDLRARYFPDRLRSYSVIVDDEPKFDTGEMTGHLDRSG